MLGSKRPYILADTFPGKEQQSIRLIQNSLDGIYSHIESFHATVMLFDFCENAQVESVIKTINMNKIIESLNYRNNNILIKWKFIAARDGVMTIYHISTAMDGISLPIKDCPSFASHVDFSKLRGARKLFKQFFPKFLEFRHAIAHIADLMKSIEKLEKKFL